MRHFRCFRMRSESCSNAVGILAWLARLNGPSRSTPGTSVRRSLLAAALAPYQAPATATAVTCRGTATSTVGAAPAAALAPYHVREV